MNDGAGTLASSKLYARNSNTFFYVGAIAHSGKVTGVMGFFPTMARVKI
jgi:hypothetical protein